MPPGGEALAQAFYGDILEIPMVPKPVELTGRGGCWFERGDLKIHVGVEQEFRPATKAHPALRVDGLGELLERLRRHSIAVVEEGPLDGHDRVYVQDPFGNRIELIEVAPTAR